MFFLAYIILVPLEGDGELLLSENLSDKAGQVGFDATNRCSVGVSNPEPLLVESAALLTDLSGTPGRI